MTAPTRHAPSERKKGSRKGQAEEHSAPRYDDDRAGPPAAAVAVPSVTVGRADDPAEAAADRMADSVLATLAGLPSDEAAAGSRAVSGAGSRAQPSTGATATPSAARAVASAAPATAPSNAAPIGAAGGQASADTSALIDQQRGRGKPLDGSVRRRMESAFGHDFGSVSIHDGADAAAANKAISARAFTLGSDIFFGAGEYKPTDPDGEHVLAHELAHVTQDGGTAHRFSLMKKIKSAVKPKSGGQAPAAAAPAAPPAPAPVPMVKRGAISDGVKTDPGKMDALNKRFQKAARSEQAAKKDGAQAAYQQAWLAGKDRDLQAVRPAPAEKKGALSSLAGAAEKTGKKVGLLKKGMAGLGKFLQKSSKSAGEWLKKANELTGGKLPMAELGAIAKGVGTAGKGLGLGSEAVGGAGDAMVQGGKGGKKLLDENAKIDAGTAEDTENGADGSDQGEAADGGEAAEPEAAEGGDGGEAAETADTAEAADGGEAAETADTAEAADGGEAAETADTTAEGGESAEPEAAEAGDTTAEGGEAAEPGAAEGGEAAEPEAAEGGEAAEPEAAEGGEAAETADTTEDTDGETQQVTEEAVEAATTDKKQGKTPLGAFFGGVTTAGKKVGLGKKALSGIGNFLSKSSKSSGKWLEKVNELSGGVLPMPLLTGIAKGVGLAGKGLGLGAEAVGGAGDAMVQGGKGGQKLLDENAKIDADTDEDTNGGEQTDEQIGTDVADESDKPEGEEGIRWRLDLMFHGSKPADRAKKRRADPRIKAASQAPFQAAGSIPPTILDQVECTCGKARLYENATAQHLKLFAEVVGKESDATLQKASKDPMNAAEWQAFFRKLLSDRALEGADK